MAKIRCHVLISGLVQGVFFRTSMRREAEAAKVNGWVRNLPGGQVEAELEGEEEDVGRVVEWARQGPENAAVERVDVEERPHQDEFLGFAVR